MKQTEKPTATKGVWTVVQNGTNPIVHIGESKRYAKVYGHSFYEGESIAESTAIAQNNARAICEAVNNTYSAGINPEAVPAMLEALLEAEASLSTFEESENAWEATDAAALTLIRKAINAATA